MVDRVAFNVVPPHVEYTLTPLGVESGGEGRESGGLGCGAYAQHRRATGAAREVSGARGLQPSRSDGRSLGVPFEPGPYPLIPGGPLGAMVCA